MFDLRDGSVTYDRRLDRLPQRDAKSRDFPISAVVPAEIVRGRTWACPAYLDQGREGACVGFGVSHELAASPVRVSGLTYSTAYDIYRAAQKIDPWPGEGYEGTSVLAGVKIAHERGYFDSYRWCFTVEDILRALAHEGPVVVGTDWRDSMSTPRPSGRLDCSGSVAGGHCYLIRGFSLRARLRGEKVEPMFRIRNSWGLLWGKNADAWITVEDYERYLMPGADQVVFVGRKRPVLS
jgi:hypothetical protein